MNDMVDMSHFVEAKSDQLNSDDLLGAPRTITVRKVTGAEGDQPVSIYYEGDNNKPFKPCKTARRVLLGVWGRYAQEYVGRSMTLYRDDEVTFGGLAVGGIRISHMSHIESEKIVVVAKTKGKKVGIKILPLKVEQGPDKAAEAADKIIANIGRAPDADKLEAYIAGKPSEVIEGLRTDRPELAAKIDAALTTRRAELPRTDDDPFAEPTPDKPVYAELVTDLRNQIDAAKTIAALEKAEKRFADHRDALPEEVGAEIDGLIAGRRVEIGEG